MLGLHAETPPEWAHRVLAQPAPLLLDHVFCEQKAAATARLIERRWGMRFPKLVRPLQALAVEELAHADRVERFLAGYARPASPRGGSPYAQGLRRLVRTDVRGVDPLLDLLLCASLIEARSAERFRRLADAASASTLAALGHFYEDLYAAEVDHYVFFVDVARDLFGAAAEPRLEELRRAEAALIRSLPPGPRIHSGA